MAKIRLNALARGGIVSHRMKSYFFNKYHSLISKTKLKYLT